MPVVCHLKRLRMDAGLTQAQLGERAGGIFQEYVSRIEKGDMIPTKAQLLAITAALGASPTDVYPAEVVSLIEAAEVGGTVT